MTAWDEVRAARPLVDVNRVVRQDIKVRGGLGYPLVCIVLLCCKFVNVGGKRIGVFHQDCSPGAPCCGGRPAGGWGGHVHHARGPLRWLSSSVQHAL